MDGWIDVKKKKPALAHDENLSDAHWVPKSHKNRFISGINIHLGIILVFDTMRVKLGHHTSYKVQVH